MITTAEVARADTVRLADWRMNPLKSIDAQIVERPC